MEAYCDNIGDFLAVGVTGFGLSIITQPSVLGRIYRPKGTINNSPPCPHSAHASHAVM